MAEKRAPVQGFSAGIPWDMHLRAYDAYCKRYGAQEALIDLEGRGCRGGFHTEELDAFIPGWRAELDERNQLRAEIERLKAGIQEIAELVELEPSRTLIYNALKQLTEEGGD